MAFSIEWIERKARVPRPCMGLAYAQGCGAAIKSGDKFYQSKQRCGLDHAELCEQCAAAIVKTGLSVAV